jgi:hypothetical protein
MELNAAQIEALRKIATEAVYRLPAAPLAESTATW